MAAKASGYSLTPADIPIVLGMAARGDRSHDIAAWFGVNQGRIKEAKDGKFGTPPAAPAHRLPPSGPPGVKGRRLREAAENALKALRTGGAGGTKKAVEILEASLGRYDTNER
jgi:hypothetical protein